jgi:hypothetical protein
MATYPIGAGYQPRRQMNCHRKRVLRSRGFLAISAIAFAGAATAQTASPFAFLFGGSPWEGRSAYAPGPLHPSSPYGGYQPSPYGYSSVPDYYEPYEYQPPRVRRWHRPPVQVEKRASEPSSPKENIAAIEAAKGGDGPLGPFLKDPTLRAGDVVVTTKGFMVFRGEEGQSHRESDFVSIANASGPVANKKTLVSLEKASRLTPRKPLGAEAKRANPPSPEFASSRTARKQ